jgi:hypothetical protein
MIPVSKSLIFNQLLALFKESSDRDAFVNAFKTNYPNLNDQERAALLKMLLGHVEKVLAKPEQPSH